MLRQGCLLISVTDVLYMWKKTFLVLKGRVMSIVIWMLLIVGTMAMSRIICKDCGKTWQDKKAYDEDPGCDRGWCENSREAVMARRAGRRGNKPPHIEVPVIIDEPVGDGKVPQVRLQVHQTSGPVLSRWDKNEDILEVVIPDVININIFPRKGFK